jgi:NAD(P)-dependent dehydrogenase (short-subunit alcohol dehydrogenase family)
MSLHTHDGRVAVVTGATGGFGQAFSVGLAQRGATIVAVDIQDSSETVRLIEKLGGKAIAIAADISDPEAVAGIGERVRNEFGRCDILINNAGIYPNRPFEDLDFERDSLPREQDGDHRFPSSRDRRLWPMAAWLVSDVHWVDVRLIRAPL